MLEDDGRGLLYVPVLNYSDGDLHAAREMLLHPRAASGLGDGGAHCGDHLRRLAAHLHAHALDPRPVAGASACRSSGS